MKSKSLLSDFRESIKRVNSSQLLQWTDLAFTSKKPLRELDATFIAAPREMSTARLTQLIKNYLPTGNIVIGCALESFIEGFEGQSQFKTLTFDVIEKLASKVNNSNSPHTVTILQYNQRDTLAIYEKIKFRQVVLINGSWRFSFHTRPEYYALVSKQIPFTFVSPFIGEEEARVYAEEFTPQPLGRDYGEVVDETDMLTVASAAATASFDCSFQTGVALGRKQDKGYELLASAYNRVVPYQAFAWHFGALRERHLSPPGDLNYYDAIHAEVMLLIQAQKQKLDLIGTTLFINLLPCPSCARMFCETDISEFVYSLDHSNGYAVALLEKAGKTVRRVINVNDIV